MWTQIITGATGSIGAHTLAQLTAKSEFQKVYCLVRGAEPLRRVLDSLKERHLELPEASKAKIIALTSDLSLPEFSLDASILTQMRREVSLVIHIAWPVNFNIRLQTFEPHLAGLYNLLRFCLSVPQPEAARLLFCSSISTASNTPPPASIPEAPIADFTHAAQTGYARSKLVGEHIVCNATRAGARSYVLRIGQVVGDTAKGAWNDKEFLPSMVRSALTLKTLPTLREVCFLFDVHLHFLNGLLTWPPALLLASRRHACNCNTRAFRHTHKIFQPPRLRCKGPFHLLQHSQPVCILMG